MVGCAATCDEEFAGAVVEAVGCVDGGSLDGGLLDGGSLDGGSVVGDCALEGVG